MVRTTNTTEEDQMLMPENCPSCDISTCLTVTLSKLLSPRPFQPTNQLLLHFPCPSLPCSPFSISPPLALHTRALNFDTKPRSQFPISSSSPWFYNDKARFPQKLNPLLHPTLRTRMGDMYSYDDTDNHDFLASSTSSSPQDEISLFLRQILLRSSSSLSASSSLLVTDTVKNAHTSTTGLCSSHATLENAHASDRSSLFQDGISVVVDSSFGVGAPNDGFLSSSGTYTLANMKGGSAVNRPSSSFGVSGNEFDEYDCESEEGIEALVTQQPVMSVPPRSSSKRSRAAEVHNLSEKRRRSRINEKMKALQNLIPNSNKTDKASMLDEAIEYLKQLQLQVQMLSMRNGLSLHPMCFSEDLQAQQFCQMRSELNKENSSLPSNMETTLPLTQENPLQYESKSSLPDKPNTQDQPLVPSPSYTINPETTFVLDSPILPHTRSLPQKRTCEMRSNEILRHQQLNANHSDTNPLGGSQVSHTFNMQTPEQKGKGFETDVVGKDQLASILRNSVNNVNITSRFRRLQAGESICEDDIKTEKPSLRGF